MKLRIKESLKYAVNYYSDEKLVGAMEILIAWPFEYQAVKNFRSRHGLSTPMIDHPLLKTPMAIDHRPDMVGWLDNMPEIYHHITDELININPELKVIYDLF